MAIPFSNTTLRIPRGFGNLLEGLAREVLRSQPKDIPTFAAQYFSTLLKEREESGLDPAEWGAKLEDRYYNNHAFKALGKENEADGGRKPQQEAVETVHEKSKTDTPRYVEDESIQPVHLSTISSANFNVFDEEPGKDSCGPLSIDNNANEDISNVDTAANIEEELIQPAHISTISSANFNVFDDVPGVESSEPLLIGKKASEGISSVGTPGNIEEELIQPAHISTISSANFNVFDDVPGVEFSDPPLIGNKASEGISSIGTPGNIDEELIQPAHISTISSANFNIFDEVPGVESSDLPSIGIEASEDVCGAELRPSPVAPYGGIANVDICAEGLKVPEPVGDFSLSAALGTPSPLPSPLQVPEGSPAAGSPGSLLLDFGDDDARQTPSSEGVPLRAYVADIMRGEEPGTPEALVEHGDGQEENVEATDIDKPTKSELHSKGGETSRTDPQTGGEEILQLDLPVKALKDDPPSGVALGSARENESNAAGNSAENIQPQTVSTVEAVPIPDAASRDTPRMGEVRLTAGEQDIKDPEEPGQGSVEQQEQDTELEEKEQGEASEDLDQGAKSEGQNQGTEPGEQHQDKKPKGQNQGVEHYQRTKSEDQNQGEEPQKQNHRAESEEQNQGTEPEEPNRRAEHEDQGADLEKQNQRAEPKEQIQGAELVDQSHGAESAQQILAVMPEVAMDERDSHVESQDLLQNQNKRSEGDMQEPAQQEVEVVVPVGGEVDQKEACSQPQEEEDVMDIPLDDPEANKAAAKIQAGFRGHMTRKKMKDDKPREENQQDQKD